MLPRLLLLILRLVPLLCWLGFGGGVGQVAECLTGGIGCGIGICLCGVGVHRGGLCAHWWCGRRGYGWGWHRRGQQVLHGRWEGGGRHTGRQQITTRLADTPLGDDRPRQHVAVVWRLPAAGHFVDVLTDLCTGVDRLHTLYGDVEVVLDIADVRRLVHHEFPECVFEALDALLLHILQRVKHHSHLVAERPTAVVERVEGMSILLLCYLGLLAQLQCLDGQFGLEGRR
mmetsp:Transcript_13736/g.39571  ORF Transcript_13736/g.39571 Transcript_13736/m.39571 type:complete len:229 (-) Transcript_13736:502-1188(-)